MAKPLFVKLFTLLILLLTFSLGLSFSVQGEEQTQPSEESSGSIFALFKKLITTIVERAQSDGSDGEDSAPARKAVKKQVDAVKKQYYDPNDTGFVNFFYDAIDQLKKTFSQEERKRERCASLYREDREAFENECTWLVEELQEFGTTPEEAKCKELYDAGDIEAFKKQCSQFADRVQPSDVIVRSPEGRPDDDMIPSDMPDDARKCKEMYDSGDIERFKVECPQFASELRAREEMKMRGGEDTRDEQYEDKQFEDDYDLKDRMMDEEFYRKMKGEYDQGAYEQGVSDSQEEEYS